MLEISGVTAWLQLLGWGYACLTVAVLGVALYWPKAWWMKAVLGCAVLVVMVGYPASKMQEAKQRVDDKAAIYQAKLAKARALFDERCKTAGEKIYKTVEGVEGIQLLKVREYVGSAEEQFVASAAAAHESTGDFYIRSFLLYERDDDKFSGRALVTDLNTSKLPGYRFVDVVDVKDQKRYRYTLASDTRVKREETTASAPRYGVTFDDINDPSEREYWVAGSTVKVIDLKTQETLGEFKRYVIEPGQGSRAGQRTPWLFAEGCNMKTSYGRDSTRLFTDQVLKPIKELSK